VGAPSGTVTFLFTDIEGSTSLWEAAPLGMRRALVRHDEIVRASIEGRGRAVLRLEERTGLVGKLNTGGILNLIARGLAPSQPETAAQVQGAVTRFISLGSVEQPRQLGGVDLLRLSTATHTDPVSDHGVPSADAS
jgi:class 3 adenylate cyclase